MSNAGVSLRLLLKENLNVFLGYCERQLEVLDGEWNCLLIIVEPQQIDFTNNGLDARSDCLRDRIVKNGDIRREICAQLIQVIAIKQKDKSALHLLFQPVELFDEKARE